MPTSTFDNLPPAKRQTIIDIALEEFASHPYASASVSHIVERAGIAKGSIYQYFENKQEFFLYLVEYAAATQLALLQAMTPPADQGFFELLRWQMSASLKVGLAQPLLTQLMRRAFAGDLPFQDQVTRVVGDAGVAHLAQMLQHGIERGEVDAHLDVPLTAFVLQRVLGDLGIFVTQRLGLSLAAAAADPSQLDRPELEDIYDTLVALLRSGLARRT